MAVNSDTALCLYVDGRLTGTCDTALVATGTLDASQLLIIGADASGATGGNFWAGDIDDVYFSGGGVTTSENLTQMQIRKRYLEGRAALQKRSILSTSANSGTSTSITKTSAGWVLNDYTGEVLEITGGSCIGQTRTVTGNAVDTINVSPAWNSCTPDGTTTFEIQPEQLWRCCQT